MAFPKPFQMKISMALFTQNTIFIYLFVNKLAKLNLLTNVHRLFTFDQWIATQEAEKFNLVHPCWELPLFMLPKVRQLEILDSKDIWTKAFVAAAAENGVETCCCSKFFLSKCPCFPNVFAVKMRVVQGGWKCYWFCRCFVVFIARLTLTQDCS